MEKKLILFVLALVMVSSFVYAYNPNNYAGITVTLLNQDPDPAQPGDYLELRWKIEKHGNEQLDNLQFKLETEYPFYFDKADNPIKTVGSWAGYPDETEEYYTLYYKVRVDKDAIEDTYKLKLKFKYDNIDWMTTEQDIRVADKLEPKFAIGSVSSSPAKLVADTQEATLDLELENIGDGDSQNVKMTLVLPDGFTPTNSYSDRVTLGTVAADSSEEGQFIFDIDKNLKSGNYDANLEIEYKDANDDDNEYKKAVLPFKLVVLSRPSFEITNIETQPSTVNPGSTVDIKIQVKNVGGEDAESVSVKAYKESSQPFDFSEKTDFIGKLDKGKTGEAVLQLDVDEDADPKEYLLDLEIRSVFGQEVLTEEEAFSINVIKKRSSDASPLIGGIVAVAIILVGVGAYFIFRKRKT